MKALRYSLFLLLFAGFGLTASAQLSLGGGLGYNLEAEELGINVRGVYGFNETWRGQAGFTYYLAGEGINFSEFNLNANYVFSDNGDGTLIYALAGINFFRVGFDDINVGGIVIDGASSTETGLNIGAGINLGLSDNISVFGEAKYVISDFDGLGLFAGILYNL
ncbi:hypothetical protein CEQ90_14520 [Lewinellaceae bacterium SD302]|nr:hypothetical protein CEQ90_14520 [Lewinellaceae bacterium SD302]